MNKILVTGGSGFIGTNLIENLRYKSDITIKTIDIKSPKIQSHYQYWSKIDIRDYSSLEKEILSFNPDFVIHLAARTDLRGKSIEEYNSNTLGVKNLLDCLDKLTNLRRVVFAASMYVCKPGYIPKNFDDYAPHTFYGKSKVITEKLIKEKQTKNKENRVLVRIYFHCLYK